MNNNHSPVIPITSAITWSTIKECEDVCGKLSFKYRLQKPTRAAIVTKYFNDQYRITWGHLTRVASCNDENLINEEFARIEQECSLNKLLTQHVQKLMAQRQSLATHQEHINGWNLTNYFVSSQWQNICTESSDQAHCVKPIMYLTRRSPFIQDGKLEFNKNIENQLFFGVCDVLVDPLHNSASIKRTIMYMDANVPNASTLANYRFHENDFTKHAHTIISRVSPKKPNLILFIHGYNADFTSPIETIASIGKGIDWKGALCAYCWPSQGSAASYYIDKKIVQEEIHYFKRVLEKFASDDCPFEKVTIIAHSMGNHLLYETLAICDYIKQKTSKNPFIFNIVSAHANISRNRFSTIVQSASWIAKHWHALGHSMDLALLIAFVTLQGKQLGIPNGQGNIVINNTPNDFQKTTVHYIDTTPLFKAALPNVSAHSVFKNAFFYSVLAQIILEPLSSCQLVSDLDAPPNWLEEEERSLSHNPTALPQPEPSPTGQTILKSQSNPSNYHKTNKQKGKPSQTHGNSVPSIQHQHSEPLPVTNTTISPKDLFTVDLAWAKKFYAL